MHLSSSASMADNLLNEPYINDPELWFGPAASPEPSLPVDSGVMNTHLCETAMEVSTSQETIENSPESFENGLKNAKQSHSKATQPQVASCLGKRSITSKDPNERKRAKKPGSSVATHGQPSTTEAEALCVNTQTPRLRRSRLQAEGVDDMLPTSDVFRRYDKDSEDDGKDSRVEKITTDEFSANSRVLIRRSRSLRPSKSRTTETRPVTQGRGTPAAFDDPEHVADVRRIADWQFLGHEMQYKMVLWDRWSTVLARWWVAINGYSLRGFRQTEEFKDFESELRKTRDFVEKSGDFGDTTELYRRWEKCKSLFLDEQYSGAAEEVLCKFMIAMALFKKAQDTKY
jgi:hypothetical protein